MGRLLQTLAILIWVPALLYAGLTIAYRAGAIDLGTLFGTLLTPERSPGWLIIALGAAALVALGVGVVFLFRRRPRAGLVALVAAFISTAMALGPLQMFATARDVPPIHDISTDTVDPPLFVATAPFRVEGMNPPDYDATQRDAQIEGYPDLLPIRVAVPVDRAYGAALAAAKEIGLEIVARDPVNRTIEGTATTRWFGFRDDVIIRVRPDGEDGAVIDIRSKSRVGRSDIGANAARIRELRERILDRVPARD